ncbi:MAG: TRAP transporter substrate-binding protein [Janthinobacterium lividum]
MAYNGIPRRAALGGVAAGIGVAATSHRARAAPLTLRFSSSQSNDPRYGNGRVYYDRLIDALKANQLDEQVAIRFFPDNQLGQEIDVANQIKLGVIDMTVTGASIFGNLVAPFAMLDLGYLWQDFPHQTRAFDAGASKPLEGMLLKNANIRVCGWSYSLGARNVLCKTPAGTPETIANKKIRTLPNPVITEVLRRMGAAATPLAFGEVYTAMQAGVLDGVEHDAPTILNMRFAETAKYYAETAHIYQVLGCFVSEATLKRMPAKLRDGFLDACEKAAIPARQRALDATKEATDALKAQGLQEVVCDREAFRKLVLPQTAEFVKAHPEIKSVVEIVQSTRT